MGMGRVETERKGGGTEVSLNAEIIEREGDRKRRASGGEQLEKGGRQHGKKKKKEKAVN